LITSNTVLTATDALEQTFALPERLRRGLVQPGDQHFYLAAFTNPAGPVLSVVDAATGAWVENVAAGKKVHSVAVDPLTNHIFPEYGLVLSSTLKCDVRYAKS
jgi:hypothetical protein